MKISITVSLDVTDKNAAKAFLQYVRTFDASNPGYAFRIAVNAPGLPLADMEQLLDITPPFAFRKTVPL